MLITIDPNTGKTTPLFPHDDVVYEVRVLLTAEGLPSSAYQTQLGLAKRNRALKPVKICDDATSVIWSPDGKQLIVNVMSRDRHFAGDRPVTLVAALLMNLDGSERRALPVPGTQDVLDWSADGKSLLTVSRYNRKALSHFVTREELRDELHVLGVDGTEKCCLTPQNESNPSGRFSPDGRRVAYWGKGISGQLHCSIGVVNTDGTNRRTVVPYQELIEPRCLCWSPNGDYLAVGMQLYRKSLFGGYVASAFSVLGNI